MLDKAPNYKGPVTRVLYSIKNNQFYCFTMAKHFNFQCFHPLSGRIYNNNHICQMLHPIQRKNKLKGMLLSAVFIHSLIYSKVLILFHLMLWCVQDTPSSLGYTELPEVIRFYVLVMTDPDTFFYWDSLFLKYYFVNVLLYRLLSWILSIYMGGNMLFLQ